MRAASWRAGRRRRSITARAMAAARAGRAGGPPVRVLTRPRDRRRDRSCGMTVPATDASTLLEVRSLRKFFPVTEGILARRLVGEVRAVDGVDFTLRSGVTLGLVGEGGWCTTRRVRCIVLIESTTAGECIYTGFA